MSSGNYNKGMDDSINLFGMSKEKQAAEDGSQMTVLHENGNCFCLAIRDLTQGQEGVLERVSVAFPVIQLLLFFTEIYKSLFRCSNLPQHFVGNLSDKLNAEDSIREQSA